MLGPQKLRPPSEGKVHVAVIANAEDERGAARRALPRMLYDYIDGGANDDITLRRENEDLRGDLRAPSSAWAG